MNRENPLPLNLSYLKELSGGNIDFEREMLALFVSEVGIDVTDLEAAIQTTDLDKIAYIGHKLKSSIQLVGYESLFPLLTKMEEVKGKNTLNQHDSENLSHLIHQLKHGFSDIEQILNEV